MAATLWWRADHLDSLHMETAVLWQFVGDVVVAWPALARLGESLRHHDGAGWRQLSVGGARGALVARRAALGQVKVLDG